MLQRLTSPIMRLCLLCAALLLAFSAQYLFTGEWFSHHNESNNWEWLPNYSLALGCITATIIAAGLVACFLRTPWLGIVREPTVSTRPARTTIGIAVGLYLLGTILYLMVGEQDLVRLSWVGSALVFGGGLWKTIPRVQEPRSSVPQRVAIGVLTLIAIGLRFWQLTSIPDQLDNDIYWIGTTARDLVEAGNYNWIGFSFSAGHLQSYAQLYAWGLRLFGANRLGLVISSAIAGSLTIPVIYALGRKLWSTRVGLIAATLLAFSYTHIHFSRTMFGAIATLFATLTFWLMARGVRRGEPIWFALSGLAAGVGLLSYDASRVVPLIAIAIVGWCLIWDRPLVYRHRYHIVLFALGLLMGFGPNLAFALRDFGAFQGRSGDVTLWSPEVWEHQTSAYGVTSVTGVLSNQVVRSFLTFYLYGDRSPQFSLPRPMVMPLTAVLLTLGFGAACGTIRNLRSFLLIAWLLLTFLLGGVLTYDPPFWPHLIIALPAVMLLAAYGADTVLHALADLANARAVMIGHWVLAGALVLSGIESWQIYRDYTKDNAGPRTLISRTISTLPQGYTVYLISDEFTPDMFVFQFFNRDTPIKQLSVDTLFDTLPPDAPRLFVIHRHDEVLAQLQQQYAGGTIRTVTDRDKNELFVTYRVGPPPILEPSHSASFTLDWRIAFVIGLLIGWGGRMVWERSRWHVAGFANATPDS